jgi:hypothetical protein
VLPEALEASDRARHEGGSSVDRDAQRAPDRQAVDQDAAAHLAQPIAAWELGGDEPDADPRAVRERTGNGRVLFGAGVLSLLPATDGREQRLFDLAAHAAAFPSTHDFDRCASQLDTRREKRARRALLPLSCVRVKQRWAC